MSASTELIGGGGEERKRKPALRLIIAYKFSRSGAALASSGALAALTVAGRTTPLNHVAMELRHHVTSAWSIDIADAIVSAVVPRHLWIVIAALALDGAFAFVEGLSLHRQRWWGPWLVVVTTGALVPFEVFALLHRGAMGRALLLCANVIVAVYLARHALRRRRHDRALHSERAFPGAPPSPGSTS